MSDYPEFHLANGLHFQRKNKEGDIRISLKKWDAKLSEFCLTLWSIDCDASAWASVVAVVSERDESFKTHQKALKFHNKPKKEE